MPSSSTSAVGSGNVGTGGRAPEQSASCIVAKSAAGLHTLTIDGFSQIKARAIHHENKIKAGAPYSPPPAIGSTTFTAGGHSWRAECRMSPGADWIFMLLCLHCQCPRCSDGEKVPTAFKFSLLDHNGRPSDSMSENVLWTFTKNYTRSAYPLVETKFLESKMATYLSGDCLKIRCDMTVYKVPRCEYRDVPSCLIDVPPPHISEQLGRLLFSGVGADLTFKVAGETFAVHRHILNVRSPVLLEEMISGATASKQIGGLEARVFKALLHYIYTDSLLELDEDETTDMARHLIAAASRYSLDRLKLISEDILCRRVDTNTVAAMLAHAEEYNCHGLKKACVQFLMSGSNLMSAMAAGGFEQLRSSCPSVLKELLAIMADRR